MRLFWITIFGLIVLLGAAGLWWLQADASRLRTLTVAAGERGSDSYTLMKEVAEVLERHSTTLRLKVRESRNSSVSISMINKGQVDMASVQSNTPAYSTVNLVADLFPDYFLMITRQEMPLNRVMDLRQKRIAIPEDGSTGSLSFWSVIDHYRIAPRGFFSLSVTREKGVEAFLAGKVDAIFVVSSLRDPFLLSFIEEAGLRGVRLKFIPIEQAEAMALKRPFLEPVKIVKGAFDGGKPLPAQDITTPSLNRLLVASSKADEDAIYELVKTVFENRLDLLIRMALSSAIEDPRTAGGATLPLHPGAQRFYDRDKPSFLQENAEPMALIVTMTALIFSALLGLRRSHQARAKNRGDVYNETLLDISQRARLSTEITELEAMKQELVELLERVVHALDTDQVTEDGFQSFAFLWSSARDTVNEQLKVLR